MEDGKQELGEFSETNTSTSVLTVSVATKILSNNKHITNLAISEFQKGMNLNRRIFNHRYTRGSCTSL